MLQLRTLTKLIELRGSWVALLIGVIVALEWEIQWGAGVGLGVRLV